ncbi:MAG: ABC transporter permease [Eubacteriales bacterium]
MQIVFSSTVFASMLRIATPLTIAALGCLLCYKTGVLNLAMEGVMLVGAFASVAVVVWTGGNVWLGLLGGTIVGGLIALVFGLAVVRFRANHIISSIAINMLGLGLTTYLLRAIFETQGQIRPPVIDKLPLLNMPILEKIPVIGKALNGQSPITWLAFLLVIACYIMLYKTEFGLNICAVGDSEDAARTAGVSPERIRWQVIILSGLLCGLAGGYIATVTVSEFTENMISGRGFTAFTAVVFGGAHPVFVWLVTLLLGYADAVGIQIELVGTGVPSSIVKMFPFILALVSLVIASGTQKLRSSGRLRRAKNSETNAKIAQKTK